MSSTYHLICLGHNPPIVEDATAQTSEAEAIAMAKAHPRCDVVIGRWSGGLAYIGCLPNTDSHASHIAPIWVSVEWLRLAVTGVDSRDPDVHDRARELGPCWTPERLTRLATMLATTR